MSEYAARRARAAEQFPLAKIDALIVSGLPNVRYLTGFTGSNAVLLLSGGGKGILLTDPRYTIQAAEECDCKVRVVRGALITAAVESVRGKRIGFEPGRLVQTQYAVLQQKLPMSAALVPAPELVERLRTVKSANEIERIRTSVQTNSKAFERAVKRLKPSMSEAELAAELEYQMRKIGCLRDHRRRRSAFGLTPCPPHAG
jgi:Xaa-Pro aminopeptidase